MCDVWLEECCDRNGRTTGDRGGGFAVCTVRETWVGFGLIAWDLI
jgi:hypothetical protein